MHIAHFETLYILVNVVLCAIERNLQFFFRCESATSTRSSHFYITSPCTNFCITYAHTVFVVVGSMAKDPSHKIYFANFCFDSLSFFYNGRKYFFNQKQKKRLLLRKLSLYVQWERICKFIELMRPCICLICIFLSSLQTSVAKDSIYMYRNREIRLK